MHLGSASGLLDDNGAGVLGGDALRLHGNHPVVRCHEIPAV
jgi:hypothetical protein